MKTIKIKSPKIDKERVLLDLLSIIVFLICFENTLIEKAFPAFNLIPYFRSGITYAVLLILLVKHRLSKGTKYLLIMLIEIFVTTILYRGNIISAINNTSDAILILVFFDIITKNKLSKIIRIFDVWKWALTILLIIDLFTVIRYPNGLYYNTFFEKHWFLGYKTQRMAYIFPMVFFHSFTSVYRNGRNSIITYLLFLLAIIDTYLCAATISIFSFILCFVGMVLVDLHSKNNKKWEKRVGGILRYQIWIPSITGLTFVVTWVRWDKIIILISEYAGKSLTLSNRTGLWSSVVSMIGERPFFGYGFLTLQQYTERVYYTNAHCMLMTILVSGGITAFLFWMIYVYSSFARINHSKNTIIICIFIYSIFVMGIASSVFLFSPYCFVPFYCLKFYKTSNKTIGFRHRRSGLVI